MSKESTNLPASIQGDGRKFISLLKNYLKDVKDQIQEQYEYVSSMFNATADNPDIISEQVHSITVEEKAVNGSVSLILKWNSDEIKNYAGAVIDIKESSDFHEDGWDEIEWSRKYTIPKTNTFTVENCSPGKNYLIMVRAKDFVNALSDSSKAPIVYHYISEEKYVPRPPYEFSVVFDRRGAYWSWKQYDQNDYSWTELRLDENVGEQHNRLDLTTDIISIAKPTVRTGKAYLYNKGVGNSYSSPAVTEFTIPVLEAPKHIVTTPVFEGIRIDFDNFPETATSAIVYINEEPHEVTSNHYVYLCSTGTYTIKIAYKDIIGIGAISESINVTTEEEIPPDAVHITTKTVFDDGVIIGKYIGDRQIVGTKIEEDAISTGHVSAGAITSDQLAANSVLADKIKSGEIKTEHMEANTIDGDRIKANSLNASKIISESITAEQLASSSITGDKIKAGEINSEHIQVGSIESNRLKAQTLSALMARIGLFKSNDSGARVEISDSLICVYDENNKLRVRLGIW